MKSLLVTTLICTLFIGCTHVSDTTLTEDPKPIAKKAVVAPKEMKKASPNLKGVSVFVPETIDSQTFEIALRGFTANTAVEGAEFGIDLPAGIKVKSIDLAKEETTKNWMLDFNANVDPVRVTTIGSAAITKDVKFLTVTLEGTGSGDMTITGNIINNEHKETISTLSKLTLKAS